MYSVRNLEIMILLKIHLCFESFYIIKQIINIQRELKYATIRLPYSHTSVNLYFTLIHNNEQFPRETYFISEIGHHRQQHRPHRHIHPIHNWRQFLLRYFTNFAFFHTLNCSERCLILLIWRRVGSTSSVAWVPLCTLRWWPREGEPKGSDPYNGSNSCSVSPSGLNHIHVNKCALTKGLDHPLCNGPCNTMSK